MKKLLVLAMMATLLMAGSAYASRAPDDSRPIISMHAGFGPLLLPTLNVATSATPFAIVLARESQTAEPSLRADLRIADAVRLATISDRMRSAIDRHTITYMLSTNVWRQPHNYRPREQPSYRCRT